MIIPLKYYIMIIVSVKKYFNHSHRFQLLTLPIDYFIDSGVTCHDDKLGHDLRYICIFVSRAFEFWIRDGVNSINASIFQ